MAVSELVTVISLSIKRNNMFEKLIDWETLKEVTSDVKGTVVCFFEHLFSK